MRNLIKKILPNAILIKINYAITNFHQLITPLFSKIPFLSYLYFVFFNHTYLREQFALLQGNEAYKKRITTSGENSNPLLRRNIHRLEKGLIMKPLRAVFALEYIEETQRAFLLACQSNIHEQEVNWAKDVLIEFYQKVDLEQSLLLKRLADEFSQVIRHEEISTTTTTYIPYVNNQLPELKINYEQLVDFIKIRRSTRWFKKTHVCHDKIKQAVSIASQAPSACNRQPYNFYVIDQEPLLTQVSQLAIGAGGFADNIPCLVAVIGDYSHYEHVRDRHVIYIDASLASMQFMQALPTLGLSSCPLNWPELKVLDKKISKLLKLKKYQKTIMLIAVGEAEPEGGIPYSQKKTAEQLTHFFSDDS